MSVQITYRDETHEVRAGMTLRSALKNLGIPVESVLGVRSNTLITDDELILEGDIIRLVPVISGG
jgi:sulfur carrier protein ThiS